MDYEDDSVVIDQAHIIYDLEARIEATLSYIDWLSSITTEEYEPYLLQLNKLLEGQEVEH